MPGKVEEVEVGWAGNVLILGVTEGYGPYLEVGGWGRGLKDGVGDGG